MLGYSALFAPRLWRAFRDPTKRLFTERAQQWDSIVGESHTDALIEALEAIGNDRIPPGWVIDVGCGTGIGTWILAERFPDRAVLGIDISEAMVEVAKSKGNLAAQRFNSDQAANGGERGKVSFAVGDAFAPPIREKVAGLVVAMNAPAVVSRLAPLLVDEGALLLVWSEGPRTPIWVNPAAVKLACRRWGLTRFAMQPSRHPSWMAAFRAG
jgi:SAM-dependent methyltransferase